MQEPGVRSRSGDELIARTAEFDARLMVAVIVASLAASWIVTYALDGSQSVGPQLFHIPVILAAARFGARAGLVTAVAAGILCGPLMPLDVSAGESQTAGNWIARMLLFVVVAEIVAILQSRSLSTARRRLTDQAVRRRHEAALGAGEFVPWFQPIVELATGRIVGIEALARWTQADGTFLLPENFVPDAERTGTIVDIDDAVLGAACRDFAEWRRAIDLSEGFHLSVNLSAHDLDDDTLGERVARHLATCGLEPASLVLELTETALPSDAEATLEGFAALRDLGVGIWLDDFGVGQSSLSLLGHYPVDRYKIDRSFLRGIDSGEREVALVRSIVRLAEALTLDAPIVEGIEEPEQVAVLLSAGARFGQGFLYGRPVPAGAVPDLLRDGRVGVDRRVD